MHHPRPAASKRAAIRNLILKRPETEERRHPVPNGQRSTVSSQKSEGASTEVRFRHRYLPVLGQETFSGISNTRSLRPPLCLTLAGLRLATAMNRRTNQPNSDEFLPVDRRTASQASGDRKKVASSEKYRHGHRSAFHFAEHTPKPIIPAHPALTGSVWSCAATVLTFASLGRATSTIALCSASLVYSTPRY